MTTLRDLLNDLATDVQLNDVVEDVFHKDKSDIVDEYIEKIKERLIG